MARAGVVYCNILVLDRGGRASRQDIARALLNEDRSELQYYCAITCDMVGRVLTQRGIAERDGRDYELPGYDQLTVQQVKELKDVCERKLAE